MSELATAIGVLIQQLESFLDNREVSPRGDPHPVGPIEIDYPALYAAVEHVQLLMGGKLPMGPWEHWNELLELSRKRGGDPKRSRLAYIAADHVLEWAKSPAVRHTVTPGYLDLFVDEARRIAKRHSREVKFGNKSKAWELFYVLFLAREQGLTRDELEKELWDSSVEIQPNNLDQQKAIAGGIIQSLGVKIESKARGIWQLVLVGQSKGTRAPNA
jgi:hypothetical protein